MRGMLGNVSMGEVTIFQCSAARVAFSPGPAARRYDVLQQHLGGFGRIYANSRDRGQVTGTISKSNEYS